MQSICASLNITIRAHGNQVRRALPAVGPISRRSWAVRSRPDINVRGRLTSRHNSSILGALHVVGPVSRRSNASNVITQRHISASSAISWRGDAGILHMDHPIMWRSGAGTLHMDHPISWRSGAGTLHTDNPITWLSGAGNHVSTSSTGHKIDMSAARRTPRVRRHYFHTLR